MPSDFRLINSPSTYQETCMEIAKLVAEARETGQQDDVIAELCSDPKKLAIHARHHALMMVRGQTQIPPTFVMMSKAGDGLVIPLSLDRMPNDPEIRIAVIAPLACILRLAPIDAYFLIADVGDLIIAFSFVGDQSHKAVYSVVRQSVTNEAVGLQVVTTVGIDDTLEENPCFMNLFEVADAAILAAEK